MSNASTEGQEQAGSLLGALALLSRPPHGSKLAITMRQTFHRRYRTVCDAIHEYHCRRKLVILV